MSADPSYSPGAEAERSPSPPPLPPLPDVQTDLSILSTPPPLPPLPPVPVSTSPDHIVLSLHDDDSSAAVEDEDEGEPGSPLPSITTSPQPPDQHHSLASPPSYLRINRTWSTLPVPMLATNGPDMPTTPNSAPQQPQYEHNDDRDGRYVTHRPLPIQTLASLGAPTASIHHSLNAPYSSHSAASSASGGVSPAVVEVSGEEEKLQLPQPQQQRYNTLDKYMLKTPIGEDEEEEAKEEGVVSVLVDSADDRDGSPLDDTTMRYSTAGSDLNLPLPVEVVPGEDGGDKEAEAKQQKEMTAADSSFRYSPHGHTHDNLHIQTTATSQLGDTLNNFHTLSVPSRISDTTVPYQTMSRASHISDTTVPYAATLVDGSGAEYQYTYNQEQEGLIDEGRQSSNPLSPLASPSYHAMHSPRSGTASHPLAYHTINSPTSPSAPTLPYQNTISSMGPVSYSAAQLRPFSPSLNEQLLVQQEYKTGELDIPEHAPADEAAPGGVAVLIDDEKEPGEQLEPEVLAAIERLEAGEVADSNVVHVSDEAVDSGVVLPAHASEMELQRYGSGLPAAFGAAVVVVGDGIKVDDGDAVNMRKEGQSTPIRSNASNRSSRASSKTKSNRAANKRSSRSRPPPKAPTVRWPIFSAFFVTAVVIVFLLEMQYENWHYDSLYDNPMFGPHPSTMLHFGAKFTPALLEHGQHWRLIASILLHSGAIHCLFSLVVGFMYAYQFEREHGWWRVFPCWLLSGLFGQLFSSLLSPHFISVGGSAAVCGLVSGWVGDWLHSWNRIENRWTYGIRHFFSMCIVFTAGVFPFNDNYAALGACACGIACGLVAYAPIHRKSDARWQLGDFGPWRVTGFKKVLLGIALVGAMYGVVCGLLFGRSDVVDGLYGCVNCHWVGCVDTLLWSCSAGVPTDCFDATGHLTHTSTSPYC